MDTSMKFAYFQRSLLETHGDGEVSVLTLEGVEKEYGEEVMDAPKPIVLLEMYSREERSSEICEFITSI
jgi:hypothetical protein